MSKKNKKKKNYKTAEELVGSGEKDKLFDNPFDARKYGDDLDRANFRENKSIEAKGLMCGGEVRGGGAAIRGKGFKGVF
jgi:hypothetical protein|tara:strand:- start:476 stop:712 length:237 start_codon:yes stop_codon:yes gene_type:complete